MRSHKRPCMQYVWGIGLQWNIEAKGQVSFVKCLQGSRTGKLILLDGSLNLFEKSVVRGKEF